MGRFWIDTDDGIHEEVDNYSEAWIRAIELRESGHGAIKVFDKAVKVAAPVVEKKGKKQK